MSKTLKMYIKVQGIKKRKIVHGFQKVDEGTMYKKGTSSPHKIILLELTCPWNTAAKNAEVWKTQSYKRLALDLEEAGMEVLNMPLEVGARDYISPRSEGCWQVFLHYE